jgi:hypothetical protein
MRMMKYLAGLGVLVVALVIGYVVFFPPQTPPGPAPRQAPAPVAAAPTPAAPAPAPAPVAPVAIVAQESAPATADEDRLLETMAADARESLPTAVTDTLTLTDALFLPRMRIMEYSYVTTAADARASAREMRALIEARAETICLEGRRMFEMGVTLRNSFEDRDGSLFQRVYLLPEDCQRYY